MDGKKNEPRRHRRGFCVTAQRALAIESTMGRKEQSVLQLTLVALARKLLLYNRTSSYVGYSICHTICLQNK